MVGARSAGAGSIAAYDAVQAKVEGAVCRRLRAEIERALPDAASKLWHGSPVWFVGETPVVGYNVPARGGVVLLFWNGRVIDASLEPIGKFKAAQARYASVAQIQEAPLRRWLKQAGTDIWDTSEVRRARARAGR
jgi:hypothetical protein